MQNFIRTATAILAIALATTPSAAEQPPQTTDTTDTTRILSWNISGDSFLTHPKEFQTQLLWADPDVALLDEVDPSAAKQKLTESLDVLRTDEDEPWTINIGASGGRQRCVIASRAPQETLPEFSSIVPYPDAVRRYLVERMSGRELHPAMYGLDGGIPVNGAIILANGRRLLTVIADLQCCGDDQDSWQEYRRSAEAREIHRLIQQVLQRTSVDGIVIAGDFNLVNGPMALIMLSGRYSPKHAGLVAAELYHPDNTTAWTWDGRGTPFPSGTLDYQLYDPQALAMRSGFILDAENLSADALEQHELETAASRRTGRHRALLVEYAWMQDEPSTR